MLAIDNGPPLYETMLFCTGAWFVIGSHWAGGQAGKRLGSRSARMTHRDAAAPACPARV